MTEHRGLFGTACVSDAGILRKIALSKGRDWRGRVSLMLPHFRWRVVRTAQDAEAW